MISKPKFVIKRPDEETCEFYVNDVEVGAATHDSHGWEGMAAGVRLFERIAEQLGVKVQRTEGEE